MKTKSILFILTVMLTLSGCDVAKQVSGAYNLTQCKYDFNSISGLQLGGTDLSRNLSATQILQLTTLLTGQPSSVPLNFTLNVDVTNPNATTAMLNGLQYILSIDNVQFTSGSINEAFSVDAGAKQVLPLAIGLDLATLLSGDTKDAVVNIVKNLAGINNQQSQVNLQIKPTFKIGNQSLSAPAYIPVQFAFGGKR